MNHWIDTTGTLDLWQIGMVYVLLAGSLLSLAMALWSSRGLSRAGWAIAALGGLLRLALDGDMVTVFIGYKATQQAIDLFPVAHYGAGASVLYHQLLRLGGPDHRVIFAANAVMGALTLPLLMAWVQRLRGERAAWIVGLLVALGPLFLRNDTSDANNVPCLLWMVVGLVLLARGLAERDRWFIFWAGFPFALASVSRPEFIVIVGCVVLATALASERRSLRELAAAALTLAPFLLTTIPHFMHIRRAAAAMHRGGNLESIERMIHFKHNILLEPTLFGAGYGVLAVLGTLALLWSRVGWPIMLWVGVLVATMVYAVDLDRANLARTMVPAALLTTLLAGVGLDALAERLPKPGWVIAVGLTAALVSNIWPARTLWQPTNEYAEEALIRSALEVVGQETGEFTLVRLSQPDEDRARTSGAGHTHYHFPDYLFANASRRGMVISLSAWLADPVGWPEPVYFFRGYRCYAEFRRVDMSTPEGRNEHPLCEQVLARPGWSPALPETEARNHGNVWINYYGSADSLTVGLYRYGRPAER